MKKIIVFIGLFLNLLVFTPVFGQDISINTLPTGQKVVIIEDKDNNIVKIDTWINTGSINEDDKTTGISHFLEHLFFKGTQKYQTGEADKILDSKGAIVNAGTSKDYTHYYIEIPSKYFDLALDIHSDMLQNPMIPRKELENERPVVIEEISKGKDNPSTRLFNNMYTILYSKSNHPYKRPTIGTKEVIQNVSREEILSYFNKFYTPDAYTTVIVGDIDKNYALKKVEDSFKFENHKLKKQTKIAYPKIKPLDKTEKIEEKMDVNNSYMMIGFIAPKFTSFKDNYALDVLAVILGDGKSSILNQNLKEKKELVLSVSSGNYSQKDSGLFYVEAKFNPLKIQEVEKNIIEEIKKIQQGNFDEKIIAKAKNIIKTDTLYSRESISNISEEIGYSVTFTNDDDYYKNYIKNIEKVTKEDIINVAKKYLTINKYAVSVISPKDMKISEVKPIVKQRQQSNLIETKDNIKKVLLPNGATLITKNKKTNSIIALDISIKGSKAIEKKPLSAMLAASGAMSGTKNYTNSELADFLDENGIKMGVSSTSDIFSITLQTTKNNLDNAFKILNEVINYPVFSDYELNKIKSRKKETLKAISDSPSRYMFDEFGKLAFPNSIYGQNFEFVLKNIDKVTRDEIVEFYSRVINPENMVITVVGDIEQNDIEDRLNSIIKKNPKGQKFDFKQQAYTPFIPQNNIEKTLFKDELKSCWLTIGYKTPGAFNRKEIATLSIINSILGDGMSSRLFVNLREEKGLAYIVSSSVQTNILDGSFNTYIATKQDSIEEAKKGMLQEIEKMKKEMVPTKELNDAKDKIMGKFLLALETNMAEADLLSYYGILGYDLNAFDEYKKLIMSVNQNDILEVMNKYFTKPYIYVEVKEK